MTEQDSSDIPTTGTIKIEGEGARFYQGVAAGQQVVEAWLPVWERDKVDVDLRTNVFWFYVGLIAASEYGLTGTDNLNTFLTGAAMRAPRRPSADEVPDGWPEEITKDQQIQLTRLVGRTARRKVEDATEGGHEDELRFLLANGYTLAEVQRELDLPVTA